MNVFIRTTYNSILCHYFYTHFTNFILIHFLNTNCILVIPTEGKKKKL